MSGFGSGRNDRGGAEALSNRLFRALAHGADALWPCLCFACGTPAGGLPLCRHCHAALLRLAAPCCPHCALPVPVAGLPCGRCQRHRPALAAARAPFVYAEPLRSMLLALKHGQGFGLAGWFAGEMLTAASGLTPDCVIPVPLHPLRLRQRGFNQAAELARRIGRAQGWPVWLEAVAREGRSEALAGLGARARRLAMRGSFRCVADPGGRHVLLIDDVMTTGATLEALARCLRARGAASVSALVVARTLPGGAQAAFSGAAAGAML